jgi:uncharacterized membrane protein
VTVIDAPNSSDTEVLAMNNRGWTVGAVWNRKTQSCFLRHPSGHVRKFSFAGSIGCAATGINSTNAVTGYYEDANNVLHGFVEVGGSFTTFDVSGSDVAPVAINDAGTIVGSYGVGREHGFVRAIDGTLTTFDVPNSIRTQPRGMNANGIIVGDYGTQDGNDYAFIRDTDGTFTTFNYGPAYTEATAINKKGKIAGTREANRDQQVGFVRSLDGSKHQKFNPGDGVYPTAINNHGTITGVYGVGTAHGFIRIPD